MPPTGHAYYTPEKWGEAALHLGGIHRFLLQVLVIEDWFAEVPSDKAEYARWWVASLLEMAPVKWFLVAMVFANAVSIGIQTESPTEAFWTDIDTFFVAFFFVEVLRITQSPL